MNWLKRICSTSKAILRSAVVPSRQRPYRRGPRLAVELLEDRVVPASASMLANVGVLSNAPGPFVQAGSFTYFLANNADPAETDLWRTTGVGATPVLVSGSLGGGGLSNSSEPSNLTVVGSTVYFAASDSHGNNAVYQISGPTITEIKVGGASSSKPLPTSLTAVGSYLFFVAADPNTGNPALWKYDGTTLTEMTISAPTFGTSTNPMPNDLTAVNTQTEGTLYFFANLGNGHETLWSWDSAGNSDAATVISFANYTPYSGQPKFTALPAFSNLTVAGGDIYFIGSDSASSVLIRYSNGALTGIGPDAEVKENLVAAGGKLFFVAGNDDLLYVCSNTSTTATAISNSAGANDLCAVGANVFFRVESGALAECLGGSTAAIDVPGLQGVEVDVAVPMAAVGQDLFFVSYQSGDNQDQQLWTYDGINLPTQVTVNPFGVASSYPRNLTAIGNSLYLGANDGADGFQPWVVTLGPALTVTADPTITNADASNVTVSGTGVNGDSVTVTVKDSNNSSVTSQPVTVSQGIWTITGLNAVALAAGTITYVATETNSLDQKTTEDLEQQKLTSTATQSFYWQLASNSPSVGSAASFWTFDRTEGAQTTDSDLTVTAGGGGASMDYSVEVTDEGDDTPQSTEDSDITWSGAPTSTISPGDMITMSATSTYSSTSFGFDTSDDNPIYPGASGLNWSAISSGDAASPTFTFTAPTTSVPSLEISVGPSTWPGPPIPGATWVYNEVEGSPPIPVAFTSTPNITNDNQGGVIVSGTGNPGDLIEVSISDGHTTTGEVQGATLGSQSGAFTTVNPDGTWALPAPGIDASGLANGTVTYSVTQTDPTGTQTTATNTASKNVLAVTSAANLVYNAATRVPISASGTGIANGDTVSVQITDDLGDYTAPVTTTVENGVWSISGNVDASMLQNGDVEYLATEGGTTVGAAATLNSVPLVVPTVLTLTPSTPTISTAQVGTGMFTLAVQYDEAMNPGFTPSISFSPSVTSTLTFDSGSWNADDTTYTATYNVANADVSISAVSASVSGGQDALGNTQTGFTENNAFAINTTPGPLVTSVTPTVATIANAEIGATFSLAVQFSEAMKTTVAPVIAFSPSIASTLTFTSGSWNTAHTLYTASYRVGGSGAFVPSVAVTVSGGEGTSGEAQISFTQDDVFAIEMASPTVSAVTPSVATIADAQVGSAAFTVAVQYSAVMNAAVAPVIAFSPAVASTLSFASGSWNYADTLYTATYNVANAGVAVPAVGVTISGAKDANGNIQKSFTQPAVFAIDTVTPTVTAIAASAATIADAQVGSATFSIAITYSEAMNPALVPTVAFNPDVSSTLTFASATWNAKHTVCTIAYNVANAGVLAAGIGVTVSGAENVDGNLQASFTKNALFSIDTQNPSVTSLTPSVAVITNAQVGSFFRLTVQYSTAMKTSVHPTITFNPAIASTLSLFSGSWSSNGLAFTAVYRVAGAGVTASSIGVSVSGAEDVNGNVQTAFNQASVFGIDTVIPTVSAVTPSVATIADAQVGSAAFTVAVQYSAVMDAAVAPVIAFSPAVASTLSFASGSWNVADTLYTATYNVANAGVAVAAVGVAISGAKDANGNIQKPFTQPAVFAIDTVIPTVTAIAASAATIADAQVGSATFTIAVTYSEAMNPALTPVVAFNPDVSSTLTFASATWNAKHTVCTIAYNVANADVLAAGIGVTVSSAESVDGNLQASFTKNALFSIDTQNPSVTSLTPSVAVITNAQVGSFFRLTVQYSTAMKTSVHPTITFNPAIASTLSLFSGSWSSNGLAFTAVYRVAGAGVTASNIGVSVSGAEDVNGNDQTAFNQDSVFGIDTASPTVTAISPSVPMIADAELGNATFTLTIQYSAAMDTKIAPAISFAPAVNTTLSLVAGAWDQTGTEYTATYSVADAFVNVPSVNVSVSGAKNVDGNLQVSDSQTNVFAIDTLNPTVTSVTPSAADITDALVGSATFQLSVKFSAAMNTSVAPTIAFISPVGTTLSFASGGWNAAGTIYTAAYDVAGSGISITGVSLAISGAENSAGNLEQSFAATDNFAIDTIAPAVLSVTPSVDSIANAQVGKNGFTLSVTYDSPMSTKVSPTIVFSPSVSSTLTFSSGAWSATAKTYTAVYTVANAGVSASGIGVTISGAENSVGNAQIPFTQSNVVNINTTTPTDTPNISVTATNTTTNVNSSDFGESFVPTVSGPLTQLNVLGVLGMYSATGQVVSSASATLQIYSGGINTANPLSSSYDTPAGTLIYSQAVTLVPGENDIVLSAPPALTAGQTYLWRIVPTGVATLYVDLATNNPYPNGDTLAGPGLGYDLPFQIFI